MELHCPDLFRQQAFVAGHWCEADKGARTDIANPATHERLGSVPVVPLKRRVLPSSSGVSALPRSALRYCASGLS